MKNTYNPKYGFYFDTSFSDVNTFDQMNVSEKNNLIITNVTATDRHMASHDFYKRESTVLKLKFLRTIQQARREIYDGCRAKIEQKSQTKEIPTTSKII